MTFRKSSLMSKLSLLLFAALLSVSVVASDFNDTQRLANQGNAYAQNNLGYMYYHGEGVRQDYQKADDVI